MRVMAIAALGLVLASAPVVAQGQGQEPRPEMQRRAQLEEQIRLRFMEQVVRRLELNDSQKEAMMATLREGVESRRELAARSHALRRDLLQAVRNDDTPVATFERLLDGLDAVRDSERAIERRERERLEQVLDARQRAVFLMMRMQFNERVRGLRAPPGRRGGGGGGGRPG